MANPFDLVSNAISQAAREPLPESTYRLQFHAGFKFTDAIAILPYLKELGITHVYASPYLKARKGSTHGYDIVDHRIINREIGTPEEHEAFVAAIREQGLKLILDIVPNHMGVATNENIWWNDVLENGPSSPFAGYFDIAWNVTPRPELQQKVLLPVLGEPYGDVLESGQLKLRYESGRFSVSYGERYFPVAPRSYALVLKHRLEELEKHLPGESPDLLEYQSILTAIDHLPDRTETEQARVVERHREKEIIKRRLGELTNRNEVIRGFIEENIRIFNGAAGQPRSFDLLDALLEHQCYRLSFWRVALEEINYRRFFDVNELAAICVEREDVFRAVHELYFRLIGEGKVAGLRVDHPDGLYDPTQYFLRLQKSYVLTRIKAQDANVDPMEWSRIEETAAQEIQVLSGKKNQRWPLFVVAEKILGASEPLPSDWAISGTVGYEFIRAATGLFIDDSSLGEFNRLYRELVPDASSFPDVLYRSKRLILTASLAAELNMLAHQLDRLAQTDRKSRDFTLNGLREALREVVACFPVYRSYISERGISDRDREMVETAIRRAGSRNPLINPSVLRFVGDMLLLKHPRDASEANKSEQRGFTGKFQQLTSPVMAKGLEDTSFYAYNRLVSLNEVGGSPEWPRNGPSSLHQFNAERQRLWPYSLTPLSTHDTKRSEDVRARINILSEMPREWGKAVHLWFATNANHRQEIEGNPVPDANEEYLIYQTLIGAWPAEAKDANEEFLKRIQDYLVKALREAKAHSSWLYPNEPYDKAVQEFVAKLLHPEQGNEFLNEFLPFQKRVAQYGAINTLAQTLLKFTIPGVADTYQGTEIPDFSLVDPDNRRPVDYALRHSMLKRLRDKFERAGNDRRALARELGAAIEDGRAKLFLTWRALHARQAHARLFSEGDYEPLAASGSKPQHIFAFSRKRAGVSALVAVPRLVSQLNSDPGQVKLGARIWGDTSLTFPGGDARSPWVNEFTGVPVKVSDGKLGVAELFADFPVALLIARG